MPHLHPHPELHQGEEIVEEFGVSPTYTRTLQAVGFILGALGLIALLLGVPVFVDLVSLVIPISALVALLLIVALIFIGGYLFGLGLYLHHARRYYLSTQRVLAVRGLWAVEITSVDYRSITDIQVQEEVLSRWLFKIGAVAINTAGGGGQHLLMSRIDNPDRCQAEIRRLAEVATQSEQTTEETEKTELEGDTEEAKTNSSSDSTPPPPAEPVTLPKLNDELQPSGNEPRSVHEIRANRSVTSHSVRQAQKEIEITDSEVE